MRDLIIIGAGGQGRVVADIAKKIGKYECIKFLDDGNLKESMGLPVVGKTADVEKYIAVADIFVAIGNSKIRAKITEKLLKIGASIPILIHPTAVIGSSVEIGEGTVIMANAVVNPCAKLGKGVIVNTSSSIDHDCVVGDYAHISIGAHVAGTVNIGEHTWIGVGACVKNDLSICADCMIGAGAVVVKDIDEEGTYIGVPARSLDMRNKLKKSGGGYAY